MVQLIGSYRAPSLFAAMQRPSVIGAGGSLPELIFSCSQSRERSHMTGILSDLGCTPSSKVSAFSSALTKS